MESGLTTHQLSEELDQQRGSRHDRWSIENSWHWPRDTQLREDAHRYRESNGVRILATLRSLAMNALRLDGYWSITEGLADLAHDIRGLLALLGWREPAQALNSA
jgi:hypothetical protein